MEWSMATSSLPKFSREYPESWICPMEEFFSKSPIPLEQYVSIGSQHLVGVAQVWFTNNQHTFVMDWCGFVYRLLWEFEKSKSFEARFKSESVKAMMDDGPDNKEGDAFSETQTCVSGLDTAEVTDPLSTKKEEQSMCYGEESLSMLLPLRFVDQKLVYEEHKTRSIETQLRYNPLRHTQKMFDEMPDRDVRGFLLSKLKDSEFITLNTMFCPKVYVSLTQRVDWMVRCYQYVDVFLVADHRLLLYDKFYFPVTHQFRILLAFKGGTSSTVPSFVRLIIEKTHFTSDIMCVGMRRINNSQRHFIPRMLKVLMHRMFSYRKNMLQWLSSAWTVYMY